MWRGWCCTLKSVVWYFEEGGVVLWRGLCGTLKRWCGTLKRVEWVLKHYLFLMWIVSIPACTDQSKTLAVLAIIILAILVALLVVVARIFQIDRVVTVFKILLGFAQVMGVTAQVMKIEMFYRFCFIFWCRFYTHVFLCARPMISHSRYLSVQCCYSCVVHCWMSYR